MNYLTSIFNIHEIMAVHQESLKVIEKLLDKDPKKLNALDVAMANKHLLNIYEFFQNINAEKDSINEKLTENKDVDSGKAKKSQKKESLGLFEINLLDKEQEEEQIPKQESKDIVPLIEVTEDEDAEVKSVQDKETKSNPLVDDIKMEIREKPQIEDNDVEDAENIEEEVSETLDALEEIEVVELEESEVMDSVDEDVLNKLSIAFEPPVSQEEWVPTQMSSIFDGNTKSEFTFIEEDLQLEKKQTGSFDIRNMIGLNDRYLYSNELFSDKKTYENALDQLNTFSTKEEALSFLKPFLEREQGDIDDEKNMDEVRMTFDKLLDSFYNR